MQEKDLNNSNILKQITNGNKELVYKIYFNKILIAVLFLTLFYYGLGYVGLFSFKSVAGQISTILLIAVSVVGIFPVIISAIQALFKKVITVDLLASIALVFTLIQGEWISAAFINLMLASARLFSAFTERKTKNIISHLLKLRPIVVKIKEGKDLKEKPLEDVHVDDIVMIDSGDRIPVDGIVIEGQASIDQSPLTGESEPISKPIGSQVFSSTLCLSGSLFIKATKVGEDTTLSKIIKLVNEAIREKTKTETIANKFSAWYILLTLVGVVVIYLFSKNLNLVLSVLLVTCADDLAVAIPLGFTVAISKGAKHGIIIKGAAIMEKLKDIGTFVTDKTGTLTKGVSVITKITPLEGTSSIECMKAGIICSVGSNHPTSKAILKYAEKEKINIYTPDNVKEFPGEGVWAKYKDVEYLYGKISFLIKNGVVVSESIKKQIYEEQLAGGSVSTVAINKKIAGYFVLVDDVREYAKEVIKETRELGVKKWIMLTGDNEQVATRVAREVGVDEFHANLKPADKLEYLKNLKKQQGVIAMIGDGVNDAPSLAIADVSFAMGAIGSDTSIEAADIASMHDDLRRVPEAIFLSKEALIILKQNFGVWALSNVIGLTLVFVGVLNPVGAALFNFLTDFVPILNVFRIYRLRINKHAYDSLISLRG